MAPCIRPKGYIDCHGVAERLGIAKSSLKLIINAYDDFPKRRQFGAQMFMWREDEIDAWVSKRVAEAERNVGVIDPAVAAQQAQAIKRAHDGAKAARARAAKANAEPEAEPYMRFVQGFCMKMRGIRLAPEA